MMKRLCLLLLSLFLFLTRLHAHPMPHSILLLKVKDSTVDCSVQLPLKELQYALDTDLSHTGDLIAQHGPLLKSYISKHIDLKGTDGYIWHKEVRSLQVSQSQQTATGPYQELIAEIVFRPAHAGSDLRNFTILYDGIMHQVVTHKALVVVQQDWMTGKTGEVQEEIGSIQVSTGDMTVRPFPVHLDKGSNWQGFRSMIQLGMHHISEGTDHLLFLLVLLLAAPLLASGRRWTTQPDLGYALRRVLKITIAFTIGHSVTLVLATIGWIRLPAQPVEILIAASILVTAIHAIIPVFPKKEYWVASGFGLIHGLAFAGILNELHLGRGKLALSLLGFNLGIELMQLIVVLLVMPWLLFLSRYTIYRYVRTGIALLAAAAAFIWITERISGRSNRMADVLAQLTPHAILLVAGLVILCIPVWIFGRKLNGNTGHHERT